MERLDAFQTEFPKTDLLIVFGSAAQNSWYPDHSARSLFDIDGTLNIVPRCREIWDAGYLSALAPDYAIEDGSVSLMSMGVLTGETTEFSFESDGDTYSGSHTGLLAYREGEFAFATKGRKLFVNGIEKKA